MDQSHNGGIWGFPGHLRQVWVFVRSVFLAPEPSASTLARPKPFLCVTMSRVGILA